MEPVVLCGGVLALYLLDERILLLHNLHSDLEHDLEQLC